MGFENYKKRIKHTIKHGITVLKKKNVIPISQPVRADALLNNKVALITGGSGGIGFAIAKAYISSGCKVIITGTNEKKLKSNCTELGGDAAYIVMDLNNVELFQQKVSEAIKIFGKIDILVNSAGIHTARKNFDFVNITEKEYDDIMSVNLKGTYFISQSIANYMIKNKIKGHILLISSQAGLEPSWSPYRLSKCGINGLTKGLAQKLLPYGIIVNAIAPGPTATSMQPYEAGDSIHTTENFIERYIMPEEIAEYAKLFVSDLGNTIVGDTIYMSGGRGLIDIR